MPKISNLEYEGVKQFLPREFSSSKTYEFFKRHEKEILENLPDIDLKEQREIEASREFAKDLMTSWRVYTSLAEAIADIAVSGKIPLEELEDARKATEDLRRAAGNCLRDAMDLALRAYTIKEYGLNSHGAVNRSLFLSSAVVAGMFLCMYIANRQ